MSEGVAWNQGELSEETRKMVLDQAMQTNHTMALVGLMNEIMAVNTTLTHQSSADFAQ